MKFNPASLRLSRKRIDSGKPYTDSITGLEFCLTCEGYTIYDKKGKKLFQSLAFALARQAYGNCLADRLNK